MSSSSRASRSRIYNYTPALYILNHANQYQQSFRSNNYYQPTQQQQDEEQSSIIPKPLNVPSLQEQDQLFVTATYSQNQNNNQYSYNAISGTGKQGASVKKRVEMAFLSGIDEEISYALRTLTELSCVDHSVFELKENPFVLEHLIVYLDCTTIVSDYESEELREPVNDNMNFTLDAALTLRNFSQVIENSAVMSMSSTLKETLVKILNNKNLQIFSIGDDEYEASAELLRYVFDIVESLSSYMAPASKRDPLFISLLNILSTTEDRYIVVSILRSLSRLLVRTTSDAISAADDISSGILDQVSAYLLSASPLTIPDQGNNELLLLAIDFLYQYCLGGKERISNLIKSERRALVLRSILPKLLTHGLNDIPTEISERQSNKRGLRLVKRVPTPTPTSPARLSDQFHAELKNLDEPERATTWMRCCYQPSFQGEVTQISLWKAYETQFTQPNDDGETPKRLLPAVDFIKNVSNAFPHSSAKVLTHDDGSKKFVIKGIQPRQFVASIEVGNKEANETPEPVDDDLNQSDDTIDEDLESSQQSPFTLFNYGANDKISLNEINTSSALLINCFAKTELGNKFFEGCRDEILGKVLVVPSLFSYIHETLKYLDF